ncbi:hypothetical protein LN042_23195 [Kitasatospora sp. RB6PN24]|uniref:hypothetical protein n=1 Tax=Kitasatospora humi TaxID=2893891 RepID=UPI001E53F336|nr:hypothetical protein [Kitasatospora humi]MCC9309943.1 hypothetical protein [Kitasatospora humi]
MVIKVRDGGSPASSRLPPQPHDGPSRFSSPGGREAIKVRAARIKVSRSADKVAGQSIDWRRCTGVIPRRLIIKEFIKVCGVLSADSNR